MRENRTVREFDAVLFDFDGVLVDSEPVHHWAWYAILTRFGVKLPWEAYAEQCIGQSLPSIVSRLAQFSAGSASVEVLWEEYPRKERMYRRRMLEEPPVHPETVSLLNEISLPMAVVTSNARPEVEPILVAVGIHRHFRAFIFREDVARHKPAPDPYLAAAKLLNAWNPLVVEDSDAGCSSARTAGFRLVRIADPRSVASAVRTELGLSSCPA